MYFLSHAADVLQSLFTPTEALLHDRAAKYSVWRSFFLLADGLNNKRTKVFYDVLAELKKLTCSHVY